MVELNKQQIHRWESMYRSERREGVSAESAIIAADRSIGLVASGTVPAMNVREYAAYRAVELHAFYGIAAGDLGESNILKYAQLRGDSFAPAYPQ